MTTGLLNPTHIAILLIVVLIVLGPKKLPDTGRALGRSMREFRDGITGREDAATAIPTPSPSHVPVAAPPPTLTAATPVDRATAPAVQTTDLAARQADAAAAPDETTAA